MAGSIKFWLLKKGKIQGNIFQVDKEPLQNIPIKIPTPEFENKIISLYTLISNSKNQNHLSDTKSLESEVDALIYRIYNLTDDEINYIKNFELEFRTGDNEEG